MPNVKPPVITLVDGTRLSPTRDMHYKIENSTLIEYVTEFKEEKKSFGPWYRRKVATIMGPVMVPVRSWPVHRIKEVDHGYVPQSVVDAINKKAKEEEDASRKRDAAEEVPAPVSNG